MHAGSSSWVRAQAAALGVPGSGLRLPRVPAAHAPPPATRWAQPEPWPWPVRRRQRARRFHVSPHLSFPGGWTAGRPPATRKFPRTALRHPAARIGLIGTRRPAETSCGGPTFPAQEQKVKKMYGRAVPNGSSAVRVAGTVVRAPNARPAPHRSPPLVDCRGPLPEPPSTPRLRRDQLGPQRGTPPRPREQAPVIPGLPQQPRIGPRPPEQRPDSGPPPRPRGAPGTLELGPLRIRRRAEDSLAPGAAQAPALPLHR
jgi:hypothetical protein